MVKRTEHAKQIEPAKRFHHNHQIFMSLKQDVLPVAATKHAVHSRVTSSTFIFDEYS